MPASHLQSSDHEQRQPKPGKMRELLTRSSVAILRKRSCAMQESKGGQQSPTGDTSSSSHSRLCLEIVHAGRRRTTDSRRRGSPRPSSNTAITVLRRLLPCCRCRAHRREVRDSLSTTATPKIEGPSLRPAVGERARAEQLGFSKRDIKLSQEYRTLLSECRIG